MAQAAELSNERMALEWRREVLEKSPQSTEDLLALALCALQFNEIAEAEKALRSVPSDQVETASFQAAAARISEAKNNVTEAEQHWKRACELDPNNNSNEMGLAFAQLKSNATASRASGRALLEKLDHPETRAAVTAERALLAELEGGCQVPLGAQGRVANGRVMLDAVVLALDGTDSLRRAASGDASQAEEIGRRLGRELIDAGAARILEMAGRTLSPTARAGEKGAKKA